MRILKFIGKTIFAFLGIIVTYLIVIIFGPEIYVPSQPLPFSPANERQGKRKPPKGRNNVTFAVNGETIRGWLYLPDDLAEPVPCIVMNSGLGGTKDFALQPYALRFQAAGMAALTYDYRHFGISDGMPRQLYAMSKQLEDCRAAVAFARSHPTIDEHKIGVWGTSAGGGYGLVVAAEDNRIAAICAQCAGLDSEADGRLALKREGFGYFIRLLVHAQRDKGRSRFGLSQHTVPIVGRPGTLALITAPGAFEGYAQLASDSFVNEVCARALLATDHVNPIDYAASVQCPVLIQTCEKDNLVAPESAQKVVEQIGSKAQFIRYPIEHFDIYQGHYFERAVRDQLSFFKEML